MSDTSPSADRPIKRTKAYGRVMKDVHLLSDAELVIVAKECIDELDSRPNKDMTDVG